MACYLAEPGRFARKDSLHDAGVSDTISHTWQGAVQKDAVSEVFLMALVAARHGELAAHLLQPSPHRGQHPEGCQKRGMEHEVALVMVSTFSEARCQSSAPTWIPFLLFSRTGFSEKASSVFLVSLDFFARGQRSANLQHRRKPLGDHLGLLLPAPRLRLSQPDSIWMSSTLPASA